MVTEMNKTVIFAFLMSLLIDTAFFVGSASAQAGTVSIEFKAHAKGTCLVGYGGINSGVMPLPQIWSGLGDGTARIDGSAEAIPYEGYFVDGAYTPQSVEASGLVAVDWIEQNGIRHNLKVTISSDTSSGIGALLLPNDDYFWSPIFESSSFAFTGTHKIGSAVQEISGLAIFMCSWLGWSPQLYHPGSVGINVVNVVLIDANTQTMYATIWSSEETPMTPLTPLIVPAADEFKRSVKITAWDTSYYLKASFKASTDGECFVVCNPSATTADYSAYGNGACLFQGKAIAEPSQYSLPPDSLPLLDVVSGTMEASGQMQASWSDNEGNRYNLQIQVSPSSNYPYSWLEPDFDYMVFSDGFPLGMPFDYVGTLKRNTETFQVKGKCGLWVTPLAIAAPPGAVNPPDSVMLFLYIQIPWGGRQDTFHFAWVDRDTHALLGGHDVYYPAAKAFKHEVTVSNP
jgi:hypothetical protein